jgi:oligoendopeptidase F
MDYMKIGESKTSFKMFKNIGININSINTYEKAFDFFQNYLLEFEKLIKKYF